MNSDLGDLIRAMAILQLDEQQSAEAAKMLGLQIKIETEKE